MYTIRNTVSVKEPRYFLCSLQLRMCQVKNACVDDIGTKLSVLLIVIYGLQLWNLVSKYVVRFQYLNINFFTKNLPFSNGKLCNHCNIYLQNEKLLLYIEFTQFAALNVCFQYKSQCMLKFSIDFTFDKPNFTVKPYFSTFFDEQIKELILFIEWGNVYKENLQFSYIIALSVTSNLTLFFFQKMTQKLLFIYRNPFLFH